MHRQSRLLQKHIGSLPGLHRYPNAVDTTVQMQPSVSRCYKQQDNTLLLPSADALNPGFRLVVLLELYECELIGKAWSVMLAVSGDALLGQPSAGLNRHLNPPTQLRSKSLLTLPMSGGILKEPSDHCTL